MGNDVNTSMGITLLYDVLKAELEALKGKPLAMSAAEEFQAIQKNAVTKGIGRYAEVCRMMENVNGFDDIPDDLVPKDSLLREFIG